MRIVVNDIAASYGGAMTVLKQFYDYVKKNDNKNEWFFLLSGNYLEETENIHIIIRDDVKKSGLHKIWFDCFSGRKFINSLNPDVVFSLQNIITFGLKKPQYVYVHQSIPYQNVKKFSFLKSVERKMAFCQYGIGWFINKSVKKADGVIVQTEWMRQAVSEKARIEKGKVIKALPNVKKYGNVNRENIEVNNCFFYPTNNEIYKNIDTIVRACNVLNEKGIDDFKVYLTLPEEYYLHKNIKCIGYLSSEKMEEMYLKTTMIFSSYIETVGLPLLEARQCNSVILSSDCLFSKEILSGYTNAYFFSPFDYEKLAELMQKRLFNKIIPDERKEQSEYESGWEDVYEFITKCKI